MKIKFLNGDIYVSKILGGGVTTPKILGGVLNPNPPAPYIRHAGMDTLDNSLAWINV